MIFFFEDYNCKFSTLYFSSLHKFFFSSLSSYFLMFFYVFLTLKYQEHKIYEGRVNKEKHPPL